MPRLLALFLALLLMGLATASAAAAGPPHCPPGHERRGLCTSSTPSDPVGEPAPSEPEPTEPEPTEPELTEPELTEPELTEPELTEPEPTEPEPTEPEPTEPEPTEPEPSEPAPSDVEPIDLPPGDAGTVEPAPVGSVACDLVVPSSQRDVQRATPGDVICLEAGTRGGLRLFGLQGTAAKPITVVNRGGVVDIQAPGSYAGIEIRDSAHLRITGTGVAARCGAGLAEPAQTCGIRISRSGNGLTGKVRTEYLTVDHIEVGHVQSSGLGVHDKTLTRAAWVQRDIAFRDLYVHDIATEGHYHGASSYPAEDRHLLDGVEIVRNLVVRTGRDGIQVGSTPWNCRIADNEVRDTGLNRESSHMFGIIVNRGAACDLTGNRVERSPRSGIYDQGLHGQTIADNVVVDSGEVGINVREGNQSPTNPETPDYPRSTHVLRNRVSKTGEQGIRLGNTGGIDNRIHDNVLSGISGAPIHLGSGVKASVSGNVVE